MGYSRENLADFALEIDMTTIAYRDECGTVSIDSRVTNSGYIVSDNFKKYFEIGDSIYFMTGATCDYKRFIDAHSKNECAPDENIDCSCILVRCGLAYSVFIYKGQFFEDELNYDYSIGSGSYFALSAMDMGKSSIQAVDYAKTRDPATGGKTIIFDLSGNKIK